MGLDQLQGYMTGIILSIVVIVGGILFITNFSNSNPSLASDGKIKEFNQTMNKANEVSTSVADMTNSVEDIDLEAQGVERLGWLNALVGSIFDGLKGLLKTLGFIQVAAEESADLFQIPPGLVALLVLLSTLIIIFAIWSAITKV